MKIECVVKVGGVWNCDAVESRLKKRKENGGGDLPRILFS